MNNLIFAHKGYTNPSKNFQEYLDLQNVEYKFLKDKKWHRVPKGVNKFDLPSFHPLWKRYALKESRKYFYQVQQWVNECKKDPSKIKYLFNQDETLEKLSKKLEEMRIRLYKS